MIALSVGKLKMFSPESEIFLRIKSKKKKKLFWGKFGTMPTFRKGKKCFLWWAYVCLTTRMLHNIASSSSFFRFRSYFLAFFARISYFKFLEFKEFNKTIIPFALVGYRTGYATLFTISYPTRAHGIIVNYSALKPLANRLCKWPFSAVLSL